MSLQPSCFVACSQPGQRGASLVASSTERCAQRTGVFQSSLIFHRTSLRLLGVRNGQLPLPGFPPAGTGPGEGLPESRSNVCRGGIGVDSHSTQQVAEWALHCSFPFL